MRHPSRFYRCLHAQCLPPTLLLACAISGTSLLAPSRAHAQFEGTYEVAVKKQEEKKASRFSLADWLDQKQKNRAADLWLAKNSHSSPFEFFLEAQSINYDEYASASPDAKINRNNYGGTLAGYAGVAGLRGSYEGDSENRSQWTGSANIRLFGRALQDTHINLEYGLRGLSVPSSNGGLENFQNQYGGVSLNLYLTKHFGIEGSYRRFLPAESDQKRRMEGESSQAGAFIDFGILRIFGTWRKEFLKFQPGAGSAPGTAAAGEFREGYGAGLRVYF